MGMIKPCTVRGVEILLDVDSEDESGDVRNYEMWRLGHYEQKEPDTLDWIDTPSSLGTRYWTSVPTSGSIHRTRQNG